MPLPIPQTILTKYSDELKVRQRAEAARPPQSTEDLFIRCQTLYLQQMLAALLPIALLDDTAAAQAAFSALMGTWQKKLQGTALSYEAAPVSDRTAPYSPVNHCCHAIFTALYPNASTTKFLQVFFPEATQVICFDEPLYERVDTTGIRFPLRLSNIHYREVDMTADIIDEHDIATLIIHGSVILRVPDVLSGSPNELAYYAALLNRLPILGFGSRPSLAEKTGIF